MKHKSNTPIHQSLSIRGLMITTKIRLHPEFSLRPLVFARGHGVRLADDVFLETDFRKKPNAVDSDERKEEVKANIHLVRHGAIRLFTERNDEGDWVRSIDLNPSQLLHKAKRQPLDKGDLPLSLSILKTQLSRLLADRHDAQHIVPGLARDGEHVASWSMVDSELLLPGIQIPCLHHLSHPSIGPAEGTKMNRIQFGDKRDDCVIRIKEAEWESAGPHGTETVQGVRVRLILKGSKLAYDFMPCGTTALINDTNRLVAFPEPSVARVHQAMMARMEGIYLPVPPQWAHMGKPLTRAKAMALVSQFTSIPLEELRAMDEEIRHPSEPTRERLDEDVPEALACLKPIPVSELFHESVYAAGVSEATSYPDDRIDPLVAAVYGWP